MNTKVIMVLASVAFSMWALNLAHWRVLSSSKLPLHPGLGLPGYVQWILVAVSFGGLILSLVNPGLVASLLLILTLSVPAIFTPVYAIWYRQTHG